MCYQLFDPHNDLLNGAEVVGVAAARQAVSSGAIQVSSAGSCELQNSPLCPPGEKPPAGGLGS